MLSRLVAPLAVITTTTRQMSSQQTHFFRGIGEEISQSEFYSQIEKSTSRVVLVGENHEDPTAHSIQLKLMDNLRRDQNSRLGLSLEFWDRESQLVLDEFLAGTVNLDSFIRESRPPANHSDYTPILELCQQHDIPVLAANCPRRYSRLVATGGGQTVLLPLLETQAKHLLPPLPYTPPSKEYVAAFSDIMKAMGGADRVVPQGMIEAQALWDATMTDTIIQGLSKVDRVVHMTGYFHIQRGLGMMERLRDLLPTSVEIISVVILPSENTSTLEQDQMGLADFVVLTDINLIPD